MHLNIDWTYLYFIYHSFHVSLLHHIFLLNPCCTHLVCPRLGLKRIGVIRKRIGIGIYKKMNNSFLYKTNICQNPVKTINKGMYAKIIRLKWIQTG